MDHQGDEKESSEESALRGPTWPLLRLAPLLARSARLIRPSFSTHPPAGPIPHAIENHQPLHHPTDRLRLPMPVVRLADGFVERLGPNRFAVIGNVPRRLSRHGQGASHS